MKRLLILGLCVVALYAVCASVFSWREREKSLRRAEVGARERARRRFEDEALNRAIVLSGQPLTLDRFAKEIARQGNLEVVVTEAAKQEYGAGSTGYRLIEMPSGRYSLRSLLAWLEVDEPELYVDFGEEKMTITAGASAMAVAGLQTVVYPLPQPEPAGMHEEEWQDFIHETEFRHASTGSHFPQEFAVEAVPGAVIVIHDAAGQRKVRWMMEKLAALGERQSGGVLWPPEGADSQRARIRAALNEKSSCRFENTPLHEAIATLSERHGIPIYLREQKLFDASVDISIPITKRLDGVSLRSVLNLIVRDLELTYLVEDQGLVITTPENAEDHEIIVAYDVRDIVEKFGDSPDAVDWDSLVEVIVASVRPDSWNDMSGPGPSMGYGDRWLIFQQTDAMHEQVGDLLDQMRWVIAGKAESAPPLLRAAQETEERVRAALKQVIELDKEPRPLNEVVSQLRDLLGIPILVTEKRLMEAGVSLEALVISDLGAATAGDHLAVMLRAHTLTTVIRDEVLQITTPEDEESFLVTRMYDARHLPQKTMSAERLCELIRAKIQPGNGAIFGSPGSVETHAGLLVVNHTPAIQEQVKHYLETLDIRSRGGNPGSAVEEERADGK